MSHPPAPDGDALPHARVARATDSALPRTRHSRRATLVIAAAIFTAGLVTGTAAPAGSPGDRSAMLSTPATANRTGLPDAGHDGTASGRVANAQSTPRSRPAATLPPGTPAGFDVFWEALGIVQQEYVDHDALSGPNLTQGAIRGMVEALGDTGHTVYLTPDEVQVERDALNGKVNGIGVIVDERSGVPLIISVIDGSPADRAGLRAGDLIVALDGDAVERLAPRELVTRVRGPKGSILRLSVKREGENDPIEYEIERDEITIQSVSWAMVPGTDVADIRLVQFSAASARAVRDAISQALVAGASGIVLDLRGNPGGLVDEATSIAGAFLRDGIAFRQQDRDGNVSNVPVRGQTLAPDIPLAVLVDFGSASAAEIVAAALRDNGRGRLIGEQTFGTGTVLSSFGLSDGSAIRLGVVRWLTPKGEAIFRTGVRPDEEVERAPGAPALEPSDLLDLTATEFAASGDLQLWRAVEVLEASAARGL